MGTKARRAITKFAAQVHAGTAPRPHVAAFFNHHGLTEETAARILNGETRVPGVAPHHVSSIKKNLESLGWHPE